MPPLWITLSVLAGLFSNGANFIFRFMLRGNEDATGFAWYSEILRFVLFGAVAIFDWHFDVTVRSVVLGALIGITEVFAIYFTVRMHSLSHLSVSTLISRTRLIWVPLLAFLFVHEHLHSMDYLGIAILFVGIVIAVAPRQLVGDQGIKIAVLTAFLASVEIILTKLLVPYASVGAINVLAFFPSVFVMPLLMQSARPRLAAQFKVGLPLKTTAVLLFFGANYLSTYTLRIGEASKVTAIYYGMMIFAVLAGIIFLKERDNIAKKVIGTFVVLGGILLLS